MTKTYFPTLTISAASAFRFAEKLALLEKNAQPKNDSQNFREDVASFLFACVASLDNVIDEGVELNSLAGDLAALFSQMNNGGNENYEALNHDAAIYFFDGKFRVYNKNWRKENDFPCFMANDGEYYYYF